MQRINLPDPLDCFCDNHAAFQIALALQLPHEHEPSKGLAPQWRRHPSKNSLRSVPLDCTVELVALRLRFRERIVAYACALAAASTIAATSSDRGRCLPRSGRMPRCEPAARRSST